MLNTLNSSSGRPLALVFLIASLYCSHLLSQTSSNTQEIKHPKLLDTIWSASELYQDDDDEGIESFSLVGRYHGQQWSVDAEQGSASGWDNRRFIFGFQARISPDFLIEAQMHINDDFDPVYRGLYSSFIKWNPPDKNYSLSVGRLDYLFTGLERSTSSKRLYTFERSLLVNQLMPGEVVGLYGRGKHADLSFQAGLFSGNIEQEFSNFDAGIASVIGIGHNSPMFYDKGTIHLDYLYNDGNTDNNAFKPYSNTVSLWHQGHKGPFYMGVDLTAAIGIGELSNVYGLTLQPNYDFARNLIINGDKLQLNLRYQLALSDHDNGLTLQKRYEQEVTSGSGDQYQAFYAGLNHYIYGYKLKLMAGAEYAKMKDSADDGGGYRGWTYLAGVRFYF